MATRAERREAQDRQRQRKVLERMDSKAATDVLLVRHGQTDWNAEMRLQGHRDPELNTVGRQQAEELAEVLQPQDFQAIYSSDLRRATQTAEVIATRRPGNMQVNMTSKLRERSLGVVEGLTMSEAASLQPEAYRILRSGDEEAAVPGGECTRAMRERVVAEIERIAAEHPGQTVLIVAHGGVLHAVYRHACGHCYNGPIANASMHRVRVQGRLWAVTQWNVTKPTIYTEGFGGRLGEG